MFYVGQKYIKRVIDFVTFISSGACHQNPQLSFISGDICLPVCSRCTGIYIGFIFSVAFILILERKIKTSVPSFKIITVLGIFVFFMGADVILTILKIIEPDNYIRFVTGFAVGWFIAILLLPLKNSVMWKMAIEKQYLDNKSKFVSWSIIGIAIMILFYFTWEKVFIAWFFLSSAGEVLLISYLVLIIIFALSKKLKNTVSTSGRYSLFLVAGIIITIGILALSAFLKTFII